MKITRSNDAGRKKPTRPRKSARKALTQQELDFVGAYVADPNKHATNAAKRAGYSNSTASSAASRLLRRPDIQEAIQGMTRRVIARVEKKVERTLEDVVQELSKIAFVNYGDFLHVTGEGDPYLDLSKLTPDQTAAIQSVTVEDFTEGRGEDKRSVRRVKVQLHDKKGALIDLGRHLGGFNPRVKVDPGDAANDAFQAFHDMLRGIDRSAIPIKASRPKLVGGSES